MVMIIEQNDLPEMYKLPEEFSIAVYGTRQKEIKEKYIGIAAKYIVKILQDNFESDCPETVRKNKNGMITEMYDPNTGLVINRTMTDNTFYIQMMDEEVYRSLD